MAQVFLSYASEDRERVRPLAEGLAQRGFSVWWDRAIGAGDDFGAVIQRELAAAKAVIVVWTRLSVNSAWVRDEAGRARDDGRLVPVLLDAVDIPLGFGAFQAEDFSRWNGSPQAAQMQLLEEALKAKLEGRATDGVAMAAKRKRLRNRIRLVSILTATAATVGIGATVYNTFIREPQVVTSKEQENLAELLALVREGKITGEQAAAIIGKLENDTFAQAEALQAPSQPAPGAPESGEVDTGTETTGEQPATQDAQQVAQEAVTNQEFETAARDTFRSGLQELLASPDATVREAAVKLSDPATRGAAFDQLWAYAGEHPGPTQQLIYRVCAAVAQATNDERAPRFVEAARRTNPDNANVWRLYSFNLRRQNRTQESGAANLAAQGYEAQQRGDTQAAEQNLERAQANLGAEGARTEVENSLTRIRPTRRFPRSNATTAPSTEQPASSDESSTTTRTTIRRDRTATPAPTTTTKEGQ